MVLSLVVVAPGARPLVARLCSPARRTVGLADLQLVTAVADVTTAGEHDTAPAALAAGHSIALRCLACHSRNASTDSNSWFDAAILTMSNRSS